MGDTSAEEFAFRIRFHLSADEHVDAHVKSIPVGDLGVMGAVGANEFSSTHQLDLRCRGFPDLDSARKAGEKMVDALTLALVELDWGFDMGRFRLGGGFTEKGLEWAAAQAGAGAGSVRNDVHGLDVYKQAPEMKFAKADLTLNVGRNAEGFLGAIRAAHARQPSLNPPQRLAAELFGLALCEKAPRVGFLLLISAVEVLSEPGPLSDPAVSAVDRLLGELKKCPDFTERPSVEGRLRDLKRESIGAACRRTIETHLGPDAATAFKDLYSARSTLVHDGEVPGRDWVQANVEARKLVRELILRVARSQPGAQ